MRELEGLVIPESLYRRSELESVAMLSTFCFLRL